MHTNWHLHRLCARWKVNPQLFNSTCTVPLTQSAGAFALPRFPSVKLNSLHGCNLRSSASPISSIRLPLFSLLMRPIGMLASNLAWTARGVSAPLLNNIALKPGWVKAFPSIIVQSPCSHNFHKIVSRASFQQVLLLLRYSLIVCPMTAVALPHVETPVERSCLIKCKPPGDTMTKYRSSKAASFRSAPEILTALNYTPQRL